MAHFGAFFDSCSRNWPLAVSEAFVVGVGLSVPESVYVGVSMRSGKVCLWPLVFGAYVIGVGLFVSESVCAVVCLWSEEVCL